MKTNDLFPAGLFLLLLLAACEPEADIISPQAANVNFYDATEMLAAQAADAGAGAYELRFPILINTQDKDSASVFPTFIYSKSGEGSGQAPSGAGSVPHMEEKVAYYLRLAAGKNRFIFYCDPLPFISKTTERELPPQSNTLFYLADSLRDDNITDYTVVTADERLESENREKVNFRFVHLSPDAGKITLRFKKRDGGYATAAPDVSASFPGYTGYFAVDTTGLVNNRNRLPFDVLDESGGVLLSSALHAGVGGNYHIVLRGFIETRQLKYPYMRQSDGNILYKNITIKQNVRTAIRRVF
ncbi:MAG TPA: hypothetical protein DDZ96_01575 [Porphyromonadaceae bacterium]|jgi:hypothetical protein|nr:hypothetical protein [Porphyromonadaceae bacterium]HBL32495.1 hypothetical protein [Porphyromonadaceae bacterium]